VILRELLGKGFISRDAFYDLVDADTGYKLLETKCMRIPLQSSRDYLSVDSDETILRGKFGSLEGKWNKSFPWLPACTWKLETVKAWGKSLKRRGVVVPESTPTTNEICVLMATDKAW
jgi:hypothetical protein